MRTNKAEEEFIKAHEDAFAVALSRVTISVRGNSAFVGLNKIREPLAYRAALKAIGYEGINGFAIPKEAGAPVGDVQDIVDRAFAEAVEAAAPQSVS